jgi:hypothetical protein
MAVRYHRGRAVSTLRIKARVTTLGVQAGEEVEIEDTPAVRQKLRDGWFRLLELSDGNR